MIQEENYEISDNIARLTDITTDAINEDMPYTYISTTDLLLKILPEDFKKQHNLKKLEKRIQNFLLNPTNNRILRLNQRLKIENEVAIELYGEDIGSDKRLIYEEELETELMLLQSEIRKLLALTITKFKQEEMNLG